MKQGTVSKILAVEIKCPSCDGICDDTERGSSMIEEHHKVVVCEDCGERCGVPSDAFHVRRDTTRRSR